MAKDYMNNPYIVCSEDYNIFYELYVAIKLINCNHNILKNLLIYLHSLKLDYSITRNRISFLNLINEEKDKITDYLQDYDGIVYTIQYKDVGNGKSLFNGEINWITFKN